MFCNCEEDVYFSNETLRQIDDIRWKHLDCAGGCPVRSAIRRFEKATLQVLKYRDTEPRGPMK